MGQKPIAQQDMNIMKGIPLLIKKIIDIAEFAIKSAKEPSGKRTERNTMLICENIGSENSYNMGGKIILDPSVRLVHHGMFGYGRT